MKCKKFLAGILSAATLLGTMVMPVFADEGEKHVSNSEEFVAALNDTATSKIIFDADIDLDAPSSTGVTASINKECIIDLGTYKLTNSRGGCFQTRADVTFTGTKTTENAEGATITVSPTGDTFFRNYAGTLTLENIKFNTTSDEVHGIVSLQPENNNGGKQINVKNCDFNGADTKYGVINGNVGVTGSTINIENSTIVTKGIAIFGGNVTVKDSILSNTSSDAGDHEAAVIKIANAAHKVVLTGNTSCSGEVYLWNNNGSVCVIGNDVDLNNVTNSGVVKQVPVTVTDKNGNISTFESFADALKASADGDVIKLWTDCIYDYHSIECPVTESRTIDLNGKTLNLTDIFAAFRGNWTITGDANRKSKIKLSNTKADSDSVLSVGYYDSDGSTLSISGATIEAPATYTAACGFIGVYFGSELSLTNVTVVDTLNIETHPNACKTIFYGQSLNDLCTINLTDVDVEAVAVEKVIGNCSNVNINDLTFTGKVTEYALQVLGNASIKNSTFTFDDDNKEIFALYRDAGYESNVSFENTVFDNVPECKNGMFILTNENSVAAGDENTAVISKAGQTAFAAKVTASNGVDTMYPTLADAIANAKDDDIVTLLTNLSGDGIEILADTFKTGLTIDLGGYTYTVDGNLKGSKGSKSNGFYLERGNVITIQNGTITSSKNATYYSENDKCYYNTGILIQNHTEALTLKNVTLDGSNLRDEKFSYTLGNDNGTVTVSNSKIIANTDGTGAFAFDADNSDGNGYDFKGVTIDRDSIVTGYMQVTNGGTITCDGQAYNTDGKYYKQGSKLVNMTTATTDRNIKAEATKHDVRAGEQFEVKVVLTADDIATAGFKMNYDPSLFRLVDDPTNNGEISFFDNAGGFAGTYTNGAALATYTFEALAQSAETTGRFTISNAEAYTYEENRLGMTFEVSNTADDVKISLNSFTATVKLDGKAVKGDSATLNYDGKEHKVVVSVEPTDYRSIEMTYTVDGKKKYGEPVIKEPGVYEIAYNVVTYDGYEPCSGTFTLTILEADAYYVEVNTGVGKNADYVAGKKLVLVYTDLSNVAFKYDGKDMIEVTKAIGNYQYSGSETEQTNFSHVYAYVAGKTTDNTFESYNNLVSPFIVKDGYKIEKIDKYGFDINNNVGIDKQDPGTAIGVYGVLNEYYENYDAQKNILKADVNGDKCVTPEDVKEVTLAAFNK